MLEALGDRKGKEQGQKFLSIPQRGPYLKTTHLMSRVQLSLPTGELTILFGVSPPDQALGHLS